MSDYGLTDAGFILPSYSDILNNYVTKTQLSFGTDISTSDDSVMGQLLSIAAYQDQTLWEALQAVYNSQTLTGAEGIYLDDLLSKRGLIRKSASAGTGYAYIQTNQAASWTTTISTDYYFTGTNGLTYNVSTETQLQDRITAYTLKRSAVTSLSTVAYYIQNYETGAIVSQTFDTTLSTFLTSLATFIQTNANSADASKIFVSGTTLYVGFSTTDLTNPVGLTSSIKMYASSSLGNKWSLIPVQATTTGYNPLGAGGINNISTSPTGYVSLGNFTAFSSGTDVETDAEYRARFNDNLDEANAATRPAIYKAVSDLDGVTKVKIYDNPTSTDTAEAEAFTFNVVVLGGDGQTIAETIYNKKPINSLTSGTTSYTIDTEDGSTEIIKFTTAQTATYQINIKYTTLSGKEFTSSEKEAITTSLTTLQTQFEIGTEVFNVQLQGAVFSSISYGKLLSLAVYTKPSGTPDSSYTTNDIIPLYYGKVALDLDNISFEYNIA